MYQQAPALETHTSHLPPDELQLAVFNVQSQCSGVKQDNGGVICLMRGLMVTVFVMAVAEDG